MDNGTIDNDVTIGEGSAKTALLAGRYRVVRQLGQGGMGSVWLAEDIQLDGKFFAIKMLPSVLVSNKRAYRQLKSEALVSMRLTHPNIVTLRAFEENGGNPFLVMDYIDGRTLDDCLAEKGKLSGHETVRLLGPVADALDYAHGEGVVHRDVKPANVMIRKDGHPFVLDFGIAREIQETLTRVTGKLSSGTLIYMSPEQLDGDPPCRAQDIYSFAAMVYECLSGRPPFFRGAIEDQIKNKIPDPLPVCMHADALRSPDGDAGADCPAIAAGVMAGLAKNPANRPKTCAAVLEKGVIRADGPEYGEDAGLGDAASGPSSGKIAVNAASGPRVRSSPKAKAIESDNSGNVSEEAPVSNFIMRPIAFSVIAFSVLILIFTFSGLFVWDGGESAAKCARIEAQASFESVKRISGKDGFDTRITTVERILQKANFSFAQGRWNESAKAFREVSDAAGNLMFLDKERISAMNVREKAEHMRKKCAESRGDDLAVSVWHEAERRYGVAVANFEDMKFNDAADHFKSAMELYRNVQKAVDSDAEMNKAVGELYFEATTLMTSVAAIRQDCDGFAGMKSACSALMAEAKLEYAQRKWPEASKKLNAVLDKCREVLRSSSEWVRMRDALSEAKAAALSAENAGGAEYSPELWSEGARQMKAGGSFVGKGDFAAASASFTEAIAAYRKCSAKASSAKIEAKRRRSAANLSPPKGEMLFDRPATMNFCRHCGFSLRASSKVPFNCRKCGKSLFGE